jgi:hypothetical protein
MNSLFPLSLAPYVLFLFFLTRTPATPKLALIGFYALLIFVAVTIPAALVAQSHYGTSLANVDGLHGGAEAFLTLSNMLVALGFKLGIDRISHPSPPSQK